MEELVEVAEIGGLLGDPDATFPKDTTGTDGETDELWFDISVLSFTDLIAEVFVVTEESEGFVESGKGGGPSFCACNMECGGISARGGRGVSRGE